MPENVIPKPLLRWAGSKRQLIPKLAPLFPRNFGTYFEPFTGSACVYFHLHPDKAVLGDINPELIETLIFVRDHPLKLARELGKLEVSKENYYKIRSIDPETLPAAQRSARFLFLNRHCFNGLYRTNLDGKFNVPYSPSKTGSLPTAEALSFYSEILKNADIKCVDFEDLVKNAKSGDFVYLDPPFHVSTRRVFREYSQGRFTQSDLERLGTLLNQLDSKGAKFLLSYAYGKDALEHFGGWNRKRLLTNRNIAGFAKHRRRSAEIVIRNFAS